MDFEPLGYGNRWYDRLHAGVVTPKQFALLLVIIVVLIVVSQLS
jgi:hypothetical protein